MNTTSKHVLQVDDNGSLKSLIKDVKILNKEFDKYQSNTGGARAPKSVVAARAASQREAGQNSGLARSVGTNSGTGAGARDFAKQAEGLGGLVRVYATLAANIFAATAAFSALSKAADTSNMVKGLDQLGAASGRNLGSLAKRVMEATDNAVSLRESMEAVAKASSAGLSDQQILRLSASANKAAIALGLNMTDALSRLSRGISKLEPELLDELGIFVRIDDAVQKYALSVGRSASSLSDFERRQAFANAVLDQAQKKFGDINIEANPYSKLAASLQNVAQTGLELVNKVLGPIAKMLAESPTALVGVIGLLGTMLLRQAIPALGQWRQGLKAAAADAAEAANKFSAGFGDKFNDKLNSIFSIPQLDKQLKDAKAKLDSLGTASAVDYSKVKALRTVGKGADSAENLAIVNTRIAERVKTEKALVELGTKATAEDTKKLIATSSQLAHLRDIEKHLTKNLEIERTTASVKDLSNKRDAAHQQIENAANTVGKLSNRIDPEALALRQAMDLQKKYTSLQAVSMAAETARIAGVKIAWQELNNTIAKEGITGINKFSTLAKGGISAVASRVTSIASSFGTLGMVIGAAVGAWALISSIWSKNSKEASVLETSLEAVGSAVKNVGDTLDVISKKPFLEQINPASLYAKAAAITSLSESVLKAVSDLDKADIASGRFDRFVDGLLRPFGKDLRSNMARQLVAAVNAATNAAESAAEASALKSRVAEALGISEITVDAIADIDPSIITERSKAAGKELADFGKKATEATLPLKRLEESIESGSTSMKELSKSLAASDPISKVGVDMIKVGNNLSEALASPTTSLQTLQSVLKDTASLSLLPESRRKELLAYKSDIEDIAVKTNIYKVALKGAEQNLSKLIDAREEERNSMGDATYQNDKTNSDITATQTGIDKLKSLINEQASRQESLVRLFGGVGKEVFTAGTKLLEQSVSIALAKGAIAVNKALLSQATGYAKISIDANLQREELRLQMLAVDTQIGLITTMTKTNMLMEEQNALDKKKTLDPTKDKDAITKLDAIIKNNEEGRKVLDNSKGNIDFSKLEDGVKVALSAIQAALAGARASKAGLRAQGRAIDISEKQGTEAEDFRTKQRGLDTEVKSLSIQKERRDLMASILTLEGEESLVVRQSGDERLAQKQEEKQLNEERYAVENALKVLDETKKLNKEKDILAAQKQYDLLVDHEKAVKGAVNEARDLRNIMQEIARIENAYKLDSEKRANDFELQQQKFELTRTELDYRKQLLDFAEKTGGLEERLVISERARLETTEAKIVAEQRLSEIYNESANKVRAIELERNKAREASRNSSGATVDEASFAKRIATVENTASSKASNVSAELSNKTKMIELLEKEATLTSFMIELTENLSKVFGDVGKSIGDAMKSVTDYMTKTVTLDNWATAERADNAKKLAEAQAANDPDAEIDAKKRAVAIDAKLGKSQLNNAISFYEAEAGAFKRMFKEKTAAHKIFAGFEKLMAVIRIANMVKEAAVAVTTSSTIIATDGAKAASGGITAIINSMKDLPTPFNFIAGAAMAALVASYLGKSVGGSSKAPPKGFSAEEQQKVQGTGQQFVDGQLVNRSGGALGDATAKAKSIENSIAKLEEYSYSNLEYSNKMLDNLKNISKNTEGLSAMILQSGLNTRGINPDGTTQFGVTGVGVQKADFAHYVAEKVFNALGLSKDSGIGKMAGKVSTAIFGGKKTTELQDVGVAFEGSMKLIVDQLRKGGEGLQALYQNIKVTTSGGWFRSSKTDFQTEVEALDTIQSEAFGNIFNDIINTVVSAADVLGKGSDQVTSAIEGFDLSFKSSFKDLKPEEVTKALEAEFSVTFNQLAERVLPEFQKFRKPAEEFGDTITRLARDIQVVSLGLQSNSMEMADVGSYKLATESAQEAKVRVTEALISVVGGLDAFVEKSKFFGDTFLTEEQRLAPVRAAVTKEMTRLGFASVDTKEEFASLVQSLDLTTSNGQATYAALMSVQEGFAEITPELKKMLSAEELRKALLEQQIEILKLQGATQVALNLVREEELNNLDDRLKQGQQYIYQLQDLLKIRDAENKVLNTMGYSYLSLVRTRWEEVKGLEGAERALKEYLYIQEDLSKTASILSDIMEVEGKSVEAITIRRRQELRGLSATDQALKIRLWRLQDEKKLQETVSAQHVRILTLLGDAEGALALTRAKELETLDSQLKPAQLYIYALEDEATLKDKLREAYDRESAAAKGTVDSLRASSKALKEYKQDLLTSDKSILTPTQKYAIAKASALQIAAQANSLAVTDEQKKAKEEAISKLPAATDKWLEASRVLFASSDAYTSDFNTVIKILDSTTSALDAQESIADKQLTALDAIKSFLDSMDGRDITTAEYMLQLKEASIRSAAALEVLNANLTTALNPQAAPVGAEYAFGASGGFDENTMLKGTSGFADTVAGARKSIKDLSSDTDYYKLYGIATANGFSSTMLDAIAEWAPGTSLAWALSHGLPAFKNGGLSMGGLVGEDGAEVVDFKTPGRIYSANNTATMIGNFNELLSEFKAVRAELAQLRKEQAEQTGHLIGTGMAAANQTVDAIQEAANKTAETSSWNSRNTLKIA